MVATGRIAVAAQTDTLCYHSTPHLPVRSVGNAAARVPENVSLVRIWTPSNNGLVGRVCDGISIGTDYISGTDFAKFLDINTNNKSLVSLLRQLTAWHCPHLLLRAVLRRGCC